MKKNLRVILGYKNFKAFQGVSHIGLGVSAINNAKVLQQLGIRAEVLPMKFEADLRKFINLQKHCGEKPITHAIVSAPWISTPMWSQLSCMFPTIHFAMNCHSNVGFLQADTRGIELIREGLDLEQGTANFHVSGNSKRFKKFIEDAYGHPCAYLPNLYYIDHCAHAHRPQWSQTGGILKIGVFGATRALKNFLTAIGAAIEISRDLKAQTEVWISTEREDGPDTKRILSAGRKLLSGLCNITLKEAPWAPWPSFRKLVGTMHLLLQPSYTESFNMVTADGAVEGVPSVVSDAVTWAPPHWKAETDDVFSIARTGVRLVHDPRAAVDGLEALRKHNKHSVNAWFKYLLNKDYGSEEFQPYLLKD